ncbi:sensor histidine kinase [Cohnella suwonensis]|uniref:Sensor histidine kinase n=1 Tax=Cohnella suwonensis TaxID=696072 RepID=A0ABW0LRL6_9BACL
MKLGRGIDYVNNKYKAGFSFFTKMNALILVLFVPVLLLFTYANNVAFGVIGKELKVSNMKQLSFLSSQIDSRITQAMDFVMTFSKDPNVQKFNGLNIWEDRYDRMQTKYVIQEKMRLQSGLTNIWPVRYAVFSQQNEEALSNFETAVEYDADYLKRNMTGRWTYGDGKDDSRGDSKAFYRFYSDSYGQQGILTGSNLVVVASFGHENIKNMLDSYKAGGQGDPLFYHKGDKPILNNTASAPLTDELVAVLDNEAFGDTMQKVVKLDGKSYLVSAVKSPQLDWYLVDYVPLGHLLGPMSFSRNLFYMSMILLLVLGFVASVLLYRNVQRPIRKLIKGLQSVQRGDFAVRIRASTNNEFSFLFHRFNDMSRQIQELIENVLNEKLRAREANLKQLQAQINPHFLYNCLGYIINMAQMKDEEAVVSMAYNLSAYYRYTTRMERETATLDEELKLIVNYLDIQKLRNGRIRYEIDLPKEMLSESVPRLLLQPLVENAVMHGVGKSYSSGRITIKGAMDGGCRIVTIDDDGPGLPEDELGKLNRTMLEPLREDMGCGLWNTHQRIVNLFGERSHLRFASSPFGGFRAEIVWEYYAGESRPENTKKLGDDRHADDYR